MSHERSSATRPERHTRCGSQRRLPSQPYERMRTTRTLATSAFNSRLPMKIKLRPAHQLECRSAMYRRGDVPSVLRNIVTKLGVLS